MRLLMARPERRNRRGDHERQVARTSERRRDERGERRRHDRLGIGAGRVRFAENGFGAVSKRPEQAGETERGVVRYAERVAAFGARDERLVAAGNQMEVEALRTSRRLEFRMRRHTRVMAGGAEA